MFNGIYHEEIPVTARPPRMLALKHGYTDLQDLVGHVVPGARILDAGAGLSKLGHAVTETRLDIEWVNADAAYKDPAILASASEGGQPNLLFKGVDLVDPDEVRSLGEFDMIFSYWCLPHLMRSPERAARAAANLYSIARIGGRLSLGPMNKSEKIDRNLTRAAQFIKNSEFSAEEFGAHIISRMLSVE